MTGWRSLQGLIGGRVLTPGQAGFDEAGWPFNERYRHIRPAAVLTAATAADVAASIGWARDQGMPIVARGGGHSYAGHSATTGLLLDLRRLNEVRVEPSTALVTIGGGARMKAINAELSRYGVMFPLGNSDDVGIGGLTLGGGVAAASRALGLTCDSLVETEVALADGTMLRCSETQNADLFWACRGAGGGNFGVHTSFTFQARPVPDTSTCLLVWNWEHAIDVLATVQDILARAPDQFAARIGVSRTAGEDGVVSVIGQHLGPAAELRDLLGPALTIARPVRADICDRTYWEAAEYLHHTTAGGAFAVRTRCAPRPLPEAGLRTLVTAVGKWPGSGNPDGAGAALFTWGGAINRVPVTATAFPHRDVLFLISMDTSWHACDSPGVVRDNLEWLAGLHQDIGEFATDAAYVNFTDPDLRGWRSAYYGPNLGRLTDIKRRYDPDRVFGFAQAI